MSKVRSMMEDVAEKVFGRFLPQVEAQATCSDWEPDGCCGPGGGKWKWKQYCNPPGQWEYMCTGVCPT